MRAKERVPHAAVLLQREREIEVRLRAYLTEYTHQLVIESQPPHRTVESLSTITNQNIKLTGCSAEEEECCTVGADADEGDVGDVCRDPEPLEQILLYCSDFESQPSHKCVNSRFQLAIVNNKLTI